ncbi:MAG TPA: Xaa-Pro aminopeptidase, partial [Gemmatimonadales bacterium]|nr:Xaa-Pro aminopeptidase [Gemmatimonadales bacterium]
MLFALVAAVHAQSIPPAEYAARRDSLAARIDSGVVVAFGGRTPVVPERFVQLPAFRYLTGFLEPDAALVIVVRPGATRATLFTSERDPRRALYDGFPPDSAEVARRTGIEARSIGALPARLDSLAGSGLPFYTLHDFATADAAETDSLTRGAHYLRRFAEGHPGLVVRDAHPILDSLRTRKSPAEQAMLRRAIDITVGGLREVMRALKPGMWEYEVEAMFQSAFRRTGGDGSAFVAIVGSGPHSTQYHYNANDRQIRRGEVVVMDVGAGYGGYAADVTRTLPANGRFSPEQRAVYQIVRDAQAAAERVLRPGATFASWRDAAREVVARGVARLGLTEGVDATFDPPWAEQCGGNPVACTQAFLYMAHGLGHGIGLEVHDRPHPWYGTGTFQAGDVFTIEPGIYVSR